jgi:tetratricopeptide (TPR) repeat protein
MMKRYECINAAPPGSNWGIGGGRFFDAFDDEFLNRAWYTCLQALETLGNFDIKLMRGATAESVASQNLDLELSYARALLLAGYREEAQVALERLTRYGHDGALFYLSLALSLSKSEEDLKRAENLFQQSVAAGVAEATYLDAKLKAEAIAGYFRSGAFLADFTMGVADRMVDSVLNPKTPPIPEESLRQMEKIHCERYGIC